MVSVLAREDLGKATATTPVNGYRIRCPKQPKRLPIVLSLDEMARFFAAVIGIKHRAILMTDYSAGLRHSEVVALRVEDIDSHRMVIRVRQGESLRCGRRS